MSLLHRSKAFLRKRILNALRSKLITINKPRIHPQDASLRISSNHKYLVKPDGTAFLWLGDTAWELFHKLNREDAILYLDNRAGKGFNIIQVVVLAELKGLSQPNAYGHLPLTNQDPAQPNEYYFRHVDFIVDAAEERGLFIGMLPTWGDKVSSKGGGESVIFNRQNAFEYGKFLGQRYKEKSIVWILGGDRNAANREERKVWEAMANGLRSGDGGRHLITYHPQGGASSYEMMLDESILDFNMYQSGHHKAYNDVYTLARYLSRVRPRKPFVDGEPAYEEIPVNFGAFMKWNNTERVPRSILNDDNTIRERHHFQKGYFNDHQIRIHAYWNFLSGACGYTYGTNAIWQMFEKNGPYAIPCLTDWREALDLPGSFSIAHLRNIFARYPFEQLEPCQKIIAQSNPKDQYHIRAARAKDHSLILVYLSFGQAVSLKISQQYRQRWFNPATGELSQITGAINAGFQTFTPPSSGEGHDWLLVLEAEK